MDFAAAEREFRRLEEMRSAGHITEDEYRGRLSALRVTDQDGQVWMLQERTGQWYVYYGNQWMPATPQGRQATAMPPGAVGGPAAHTGPQQRGGGSKIAMWIGVWAAIWIVVAVAVVVLADEPEALTGVGVAALISLILVMTNLNSQWSGQVTDLRTERERVSDEDGWHYRDVTYAYIRHDNGKVKRVHAMPGWQVGDRLEKRRGDTAVRKL